MQPAAGGYDGDDGLSGDGAGGKPDNHYHSYG